MMDMKRTVSMFLVFVLLFSALSVTAFASDTADFKFVLSDDGTYYILEEYVGSETEVTVPSYYLSLPVKVVGEAAFQHQDAITKIELPSTITRIETYAFAHCYELTDINIPSMVEFIGSCAFSDCFALLEVAIPNSVISMELDVFRRCSEDLKIYCESESKPEGFSNYWISSAANPPTAYWNYYKRGDINGNDGLDTSDYILLRRSVMETYTCNKTQSLSADINSDGMVDTYDYILLKRTVMGNE